ncbi:protein disulfide-isomerase precursor [Mortierella sp. 14UC]|nr:protein disulfide-isomerase precursor [Mortierella sp. 14UC]
MHNAKPIGVVSLVAMAVVTILAAWTTHLQVFAVSPSNVVQLTIKTFSSVIKGNELVMVQFYAPWCPHCQELAPQYEFAARRMKGPDGAVFAKVDCVAEVALCDSQGVLSYPTLKAYRNGQPQIYQGHLKTDAMTAFLQS